MKGKKLFLIGSVVLVIMFVFSLMVGSSTAIAGKENFRIICDKDGIVLDVYKKVGENWVEVNRKKFPLKGYIEQILTINILLGEIDPCVQQYGITWCW